MSYKVVVDCVVAKDQAGKLQYVYEGGVIPWLSVEQAEHFLGSKLVVELGGGDEAGEAEGEPDPEDAPDKPASNANKDDLVKWLVTNAVKDDGTEYTAEELNELTKAQLWELINAVDGEE